MRDEHAAMDAINERNTNNGRNTKPAPLGVLPSLKRVIIRASLSARAAVGTAAQALAGASAARQEHASYYIGGQQGSENFADLPAYRSIAKHREIGRLFSIADPFYRCHDMRFGAETSIDGRRYINFASYDYLGLNQHPAVAQAAKAAIERFGTSVSASRIVAGERPLHRELEVALADWYRVEAAVAFVSGHATNVSTIGTLMTPEDLIIHDELCHNSVLLGAKLSHATVLSFRHKRHRCAREAAPGAPISS